MHRALLVTVDPEARPRPAHDRYQRTSVGPLCAPTDARTPAVNDAYPCTQGAAHACVGEDVRAHAVGRRGRQCAGLNTYPGATLARAQPAGMLEQRWPAGRSDDKLTAAPARALFVPSPALAAVHLELADVRAIAVRG